MSACARAQTHTHTHIRGTGSSSGWGTKILHAVWHSQKINPPTPPSCPGPPSHPADYLEPTSSSRWTCASLSDQATLRSGSNLQGQGEACSLSMGPGLLPGSGSHVLQIQIWAGQRPGPQKESRDHPCRRGQRSGLQGESRDHFCFVIRGQDPEVSRDHPLVGSGQDPRVKVGTTSILGGQGQGPRMRAGTTPVWV